MDIIELLKQPESKTLEFKQAITSAANIVPSVIAFANTAGGTLLIGVEDKTHYVRGIENPLMLEERIANILSENILPRIIPEIDIIPWRDTYLLAIRIYPSSSRPHYHKKKGIEKGVYIRVGSTNRIADNDIIRELQRIANNQSFDEQPMIQLSSEAIDFRAASEQFSHIKKLKQKDLETLEILTNYQGKTVPTHAGIILFGMNRQKYFPDAWIQVGRFDGTDKSNIMDSRTIHSYPILAINEVLEFIKKHALQRITIKAAKHEKQWSVPMEAIREAIINAIVHADYSLKGSPIRIAIFNNRIEIENPGLLRFGLTIDDIKSGISKLRNRIIGRVFNIIGLIEQWGSGIQRILNSCKQGGYAEPKFEELATHFRVTLYTTRAQKPTIDPINQKILDKLAIKRDVGMTTSEIAKITKLSPRAVRTRLIKLIEIGLIVEIASSAQDPNRLYFIND